MTSKTRSSRTAVVLLSNLVYALVLLPLTTAPARAGVAGHSYGVSGTLETRGRGGAVALEGCVEFLSDGQMGADLEGRRGGTSFVVPYTEVDLLFFGFWSTGPSVAGGPSLSGFHLLFGFFIFGTDGALTMSGTWHDCTPFAVEKLVPAGSQAPAATQLGVPLDVPIV